MFPSVTSRADNGKTHNQSQMSAALNNSLMMDSSRQTKHYLNSSMGMEIKKKKKSPRSVKKLSKQESA
jgi:hypothetical protein